MKYWKWILSGVFFGLLLLMWHYEALLLPYGLTHSLDMRFGYTSDEVYSALKILGSSGRNILVHYFLTDFIFIFCYATIQICLLQWVLGERFKRTRLSYLNIIPYVRGTFDIVENALFIFLMIQMPKEYPSIVPVMSFVTQMKFIANWGWFIVMVAVGIIRLVINLHRRKKNQDNSLEDK